MLLQVDNNSATKLTDCFRLSISTNTSEGLQLTLLQPYHALCYRLTTQLTERFHTSLAMLQKPATSVSLLAAVL